MPRSLNSRYDIVLAHMIRCPEVFRVAATKFPPDGFAGMYLYPHRMIWTAALNLFKQYRTLPRQDLLLVEAIQLMDQASQRGDPHMAAQNRQVVFEYVHAVYQFPQEHLLIEHSLKHLQEMIYEVRVLPAAHRISQAEDTTQFKVAFNQLQAAYKSSQVIAPREEDIFSDTYLDSMQETRIKTNTEYIDMLLGGGIIEGEVYGLLGGTGGGKTIVGIEVAVRLALQGHNVNYFSYEQPIRGDLTRRIYCCAAGVNKDILKRPRSQQPADVLEKVDEAKGKLKNRLHMYDMSGRTSGLGGIDEVESILQSDQQIRGAHAVLNIFDWMLTSIRRYMGVQNIPESELRGQITHYVDKSMYYGSEYGGACFIINQIAPALMGNPGKIPKWADSAEGKHFAWLLNGCFVLGTPSKRNMLYIGIDKNRGNAKAYYTVQMDPKFNRMIMKENFDFGISSKEFEDTTKDPEVVPDTSVDEKVRRPGEEYI